MTDLHFQHWPPGLPHRIDVPKQSIAQNLIDTASRLPDKVAIHYYGTQISYGDLLERVERLAGWLQAQGVARGDRVLLYMQNSPQWIIGYYAILRADAAVIPVNPMNHRAEIEHIARDTGARIALVGSEILDHVRPLIDTRDLDRIVVAAYADMADPDSDLEMPDSLAGMTDEGITGAGLTRWTDALAGDAAPGPLRSGADDLAIIPYSSGTTGHPKGCVHHHRSVQATAQAYKYWSPFTEETTLLAVLPFFHVTGMQNSMNAPILTGATLVLMSRWDRDLAAELIRRYRVNMFRSITTMVIDLLNAPHFDSYDLSSLRTMGGGGAAMPEAVAARLKDLTGLDFVEGYGLTETAAATHINPPQAPRRQCLGIPIFDVESRVLDIDSGAELGPGESGEIVTHGPQVFEGYWNNPDATAAAFIELGGKRFFRTGDIGHYDADGFFYMSDRMKRMINASGFKVWPAEVEALMHRHPGISEACVIGAPDARRGETVKAYVVRRPDAGNLSEADVIAWCHDNMAAYKCPKHIIFRDSLPKTGSGKVKWRDLAEAEATRAGEQG
ncbi:acyl-CoA synthase [Pseudooceanicola batsensis HTCC2597]|uniref:Acyl-CoA synthase n=1 Tax=Pseudooceanicola batsensis (strain ATCC BAA-863 / DSM 15984 / KCTC 12145 / HTCC2597) TaxID=252305 RepID=A3TVY0_PSEBH|nr:long-chain-fatty-acid--CoA ligase [Pseudooceanicola batsensis]EAQ03776.1 acyl-CoA synthase [Pseudooceanicola batsensis HTCC2597]